MREAPVSFPDVGPNGYLPGTDFSKSRTREVYGDSRDTWVEQAAAYARFESLQPERWGHKRATKGGWEWRNLNED